MNTIRASKLFTVTLGASLALFSQTNCSGDGEAPAAPASTTGDDAGNRGSCKNADYCVDYIGSRYNVPEACTITGRTYSPDACPTTNQLGTCRNGAGSDQETLTHIYKPGHTDETDARAACTATGGTYKSGGL